MKLTTMLMAAGAIVAAPAVVLAAPTTGPTMATKLSSSAALELGNAPKAIVERLGC